MNEGFSERLAIEAASARDRWYALAFARSESPAAAEHLLLKIVRAVLQFTTAQTVRQVEAELLQLPILRADLADPAESMPADVWARLSAAIQFEVAQRQSITADGKSAATDPLLVPKKSAPRADDEDGLAWSPSIRFLIVTGTALVLGIVLTFYIVTRKSSNPFPATAPQSSPATAPATTPAMTAP